jgi:sugar phosphate isomerase/epimerase
MHETSRRDFIQKTALTGLALVPAACQQAEEPSLEPSGPLFKISLAGWSFHRAIFGADPGEKMGWEEFARVLQSTDYRTLLAGDFDPLDFPVVARRDFDIDAVEYCNVFFFDRATDNEYLADLKNRAEGEGVEGLLIMCDSEGELGDPDENLRKQAVENHHKWVEAAQFLGCHSIRVNAASDSSLSSEEQQKLAADGLRRLCEFADPVGINVLVENHGGLSSDGSWLSGVMKLVDHPRVGTLPDFGNFQVSEEPEVFYDRYQGVKELMPFAKAVSAKSYAFDSQGDETTIDYRQMMKIVLDAGYRGYVGIEYEGTLLDEPAGIRATQRLLERAREELDESYT